MTVALVVILAIAVIAAIAVAVSRARGSHDGVDSFRRQIDALSPEARRPVVDQVQSAAEAGGDIDDPADVDDEEVDDDGA